MGRRRGRAAGQRSGGEGASHVLSPDEMKSGSLSMLANIVCEKKVQMGALCPSPGGIALSAPMVEQVWSSASRITEAWGREMVMVMMLY